MSTTRRDRPALDSTSSEEDEQSGSVSQQQQQQQQHHERLSLPSRSPSPGHHVLQGSAASTRSLAASTSRPPQPQPSLQHPLPSPLVMENEDGDAMSQGSGALSYIRAEGLDAQDAGTLLTPNPSLFVGGENAMVQEFVPPRSSSTKPNEDKDTGEKEEESFDDVVRSNSRLSDNSLGTRRSKAAQSTPSSPTHSATVHSQEYATPPRQDTPMESNNEGVPKIESELMNPSAPAIVQDGGWTSPLPPVDRLSTILETGIPTSSQTAAASPTPVFGFIRQQPHYEEDEDYEDDDDNNDGLDRNKAAFEVGSPAQHATTIRPEQGRPSLPATKASLGNVLRAQIDQMGDWLWGHNNPDDDPGNGQGANVNARYAEDATHQRSQWWLDQREVLAAPNASRRGGTTGGLMASRRGGGGLITSRRGGSVPPYSEHTHLPRTDSVTEKSAAVAEKEIESVARLVERKGHFFQSIGGVRVLHTTTPGDDFAWWGRIRILMQDPFDHMLSGGASILLLFFSILYTAQLLVFAGLFLAVDANCETTGEYQPMTFQAAFAFSLETSTTVGYTLPFPNGMFFEGCASWLVVIYLECIFSMILNGLVIGIVMLRVARSDRRATQIIFTDKAAIACIRGRFVLTFQVFDLFGQQPLINVSVRTIAVFREVSDLNTPSLWQTRAMRLTRPDDELGGRIFLSVPCQVMHEIDAWSPLATPELSSAPVIADAAIPNMFPQPPQRASDGRIGARNQALCPACGNSFATEAALRRHIAYYQAEESERGRASGFGHRGIVARDTTRPVLLRRDPGHEALNGNAARLLNFRVTTTERVRNGIRKRFLQRGVEIIAIVEGTDPRTSNSFQSRHSYTFKDIVWDKQHASCCGIGPNGEAQVNLSLFHSFIDCAMNEERPAPGVSQS